MVCLKPINKHSLLYLQPNLAAAAALVKRQDEQEKCDPDGVSSGNGNAGIFFPAPGKSSGGNGSFTSLTLDSNSSILSWRRNNRKKERLLLKPASVQDHLAARSVMLTTLAVVGMPSILALCSASFFAILSLSSSVFSGILDLVGKLVQKSRRGWQRRLLPWRKHSGMILFTSTTFSSTSLQLFPSALRSGSQLPPGCQRRWPRRHWGGCLTNVLRKTGTHDLYDQVKAMTSNHFNESSCVLSYSFSFLPSNCHKYKNTSTAAIRLLNFNMLNLLLRISQHA